MDCERIRYGTALSLIVAVCLSGGVVVAADPHEPLPSTEFRSLREGYVTTWYVYSDLNVAHGNVNGILDPGDTLVAKFDNWWTPVSAHTQHNYGMRGEGPGLDYASGPMNFAVTTLPDAHPNKNDPTWNYWLEREPGTIGFYMTYSQYDNNDFSDGNFDYSWYPDDPGKWLQQRNMYRNGWALGWLVNDVKKNGSDFIENDPVANKAGEIQIDIYVHDGAGTTANIKDVDGNDIGPSRSNPQLAMSNDISHKALSYINQLQPPDFQDVNGNELGYVFTGLNDLRWAGDEATFNEIRDSMEVFEVFENSLGASDVIVGDKRPSEIAANEVDGHGNAYLYQDAFLQRQDPLNLDKGAIYTTGSTDGGVIAGLSGYSAYNPQDWQTTWGDQQVIRIDFDPLMFAEYGITKIIFWDFGYFPGSSQVDPYKIEIDVSDLSLFPENRIYIARVDYVPEPMTLGVLALGGLGLMLRRRRATRA